MTAQQSRVCLCVWDAEGPQWAGASDESQALAAGGCHGLVTPLCSDGAEPSFVHPRRLWSRRWKTAWRTVVCVVGPEARTVTLGARARVAGWFLFQA